VALGRSPLTKKKIGLGEESKEFIFLVLVSFIIIFIDLLGILRPVYSAVSYVSTPFQYYFSETRDYVTEFSYTFANIGNLTTEIADLKKDNARLKAKVSDLEKNKRDAEELRKQLGLKQIEDFDLVEADIIGGDPNGTVSKFRINKGSNDGLKKGMSVTYQAILIGKVEEVHNTISIISFLNDLDSQIVAVNSRSGHKGIVHGSLRGLIMEDILQKEDVKEGDKIITLGDLYPAGLLIGSVQKVESSSTSSKKKAILTPTVDYSTIDKVFVIINFLPEEISDGTENQ
jgi:rod shape-determining protein MreC